MNVSLTPQVSEYIEAKVKAGIYGSPEEAVNAMLSSAAEADSLSTDDIDELRAVADVGIREADRGEFVEFTAEDIIAEGRARLAERRKGA